LPTSDTGNSWAELLRRIFHSDVFLGECGGQRRLLAAFDPDAIRRRAARVPDQRRPSWRRV